MPDDQVDLREYYEHEARLRQRGPLRGRRIERREDFVALLHQEGRRSILDGGAGPGLDGVAFLAAGLWFVGVDLANGNGRLAAEADVVVVQGSITALPIRPASFDAAWSWSTLMHLDELEAVLAIDQMVMALRSGAPLVIGLWGSETERLVVDETGLPGSRRPFHRRAFDHNRALLGRSAVVESALRWEAVTDGSDYHVFQLRVER